MANYETLKAAIQHVIKTNDNNEITGALLQQSLLAIINSLGIGYQFIGVATPETNPGIYDQKVFYIANGKGTYTNFGRIEVTEDEVVVLYYDTEWHKVATGIASNSNLTALLNDVKTDVAALERDLGQYAELPSVAMTAETTGKYINADGEFVDDADFNIAAIGAVVVGNTYESMRVGTADNLTSKGDATEEVIMSRKAGGDNQIEDGSASIKRIKGYSVVMNQFLTLKKYDYRADYGLTLHAEGNVVSIAGQLPSQEITDRDTNVYLTLDKLIVPNFVGEKYLISLTGENFELVAFDSVPTSNGFAMITQVTNLSKTLSLAISPVKWGITVNEDVKIRVIKLTQMFGSGKEPATPEDFAKRLGYSSIDDVPYIPYNEGEIVSSFAEGIKTTDTDGKVSERKWSETLKKYFPDGLKSAGSVYDEITPTKAVKKIGEIDLGTCNWGKTSANGKTYYHTKEAIPNRSANSYVVTSCYTTENRYPSQIQESESIDRIIGYKGYFIGEELWVIDSRYDTPEAFASAMSGVILYYVLATPEETAYDELNLMEQVAEGGTEEAIITEGKTSTPLRADIVYPIDAYNTIKANKANIGTLSSLNTASKTDLVSAINELAGKVAALEANATEVTNETTE